jgi:[acyl-carrier-protein] S-malonyltransferase
MFSVIFPGQGSQLVGMGKVLYDKHNLIQDLFNEADDTLGFPLSKLVLSGPKEELDLTENSQPAIFLISYSIFKLIKEEFKIDLNKANFFAGHSLGEYSALTSAGSLSFSDTLKILKIRGKAMQSSAPKGVGGMVAVLGSEIEIIENIINKNEYECYIANDNSVGQIVLSGKIEDLEKMMINLKAANIKNIKLPVSAPFHCKLMNKATLVMNEEIAKLNFKEPTNVLISNVTGKEISNSSELKDLLVKQIESRVRWRESVLLMIEKGVTQFIEIGPGKVLSGLVKRINKNVKVNAINTEEDIKLININE